MVVEIHHEKRETKERLTRMLMSAFVARSIRSYLVVVEINGYINSNNDKNNNDDNNNINKNYKDAKHDI